MHREAVTLARPLELVRRRIAVFLALYPERATTSRFQEEDIMPTFEGGAQPSTSFRRARRIELKRAHAQAATAPRSGTGSKWRRTTT